MLRRRMLLAGSLAATGAMPARGQGRVARLGLLSSGQISIDQFRQWGLPELAREGFVEGRTLQFFARSSDGDPARLAPLAAEVIAARPDVVIAVSNPVAHVLRARDPGLPIVMGFAGTDPVADGLAASLARPGGSVTGVVMLAEELDLKRLEMLRLALPGARRIGYLAGATFVPSRVPAMVAAAARMGVELVAVSAGGPESLGPAFAALRSADVHAVVVGSFPGFSTHAAALAALARGSRLPTICEWRTMAEAGCLISHGPVNEELRRQVARHVARILRGQPPGEIPMFQAERFETVVNLRTAREIGVEVPALVLAAAQEVIE
ncbi:ABC transporter substrate-binding protein [Roseomonas sp. PWR1]|uniref:ABC transporter substrate-binding protein n=1 Tax=Roseomonas nitratireducens TaxID=2820810 RepID=A0ABS4ASB5_9PROT|nr:ABC transporter substrate-binding protein [Neoroseomonas nitratireducens]MBP0463482.1 ABC transporter substrate-binding protein [Neoroseomonas nitratireducens]